MPELPDVENFKRYLNAKARNKAIADIRIVKTRVFAWTLRERLKGNRLGSSRRYGKYLLVKIAEGLWLAFHFGMIGRFEYFKRLEDDLKHDRFRLNFKNRGHLA